MTNERFAKLFGGKRREPETLITKREMDIDIMEIKDASDGARKGIEDLIYEDDYLILIQGEVKKAQRLAQNLNIWGMREGREYTYLEGPEFCGRNLSRNQVLDLNLGYTYLMDKKYTGFYVLGNDNQSDYRIVVLGGSTTDGGAYDFKSWVDYLYEKCAENDVTIFNGGVAGYTSTQELIKLLRDVLNLSPDLIIVYDGVNDAYENYKRKPYKFPYLENVFSVASGQSLNISTGTFCRDNRESFDIWYDTMELMCLISQGKGIRFFSFLQSMLGSKKETSLTLRDKTMIAGKSITNKEYMSDAGSYRSLARERRIAEVHDYMYDLSDIFDEKDVYLDDCHVFEEGNRIIADKIWEEVKDYVIADRIPN